MLYGRSSKAIRIPNGEQVGSMGSAGSPRGPRQQDIDAGKKVPKLVSISGICIQTTFCVYNNAVDLLHILLNRFTRLDDTSIVLGLTIWIEVAKFVDHSKRQAVEYIFRKIFVEGILHNKLLRYTPSTTAGSIFSCRLSSRPIFSDGSLFPFRISLTRALLSPSISASFDCVIPIS